MSFFFPRFEPEGHFVFFSLHLSLSFFLSSRIDAKRDGEFIGIDIGNDKLPSLIRDFCD